MTRFLEFFCLFKTRLFLTIVATVLEKNALPNHANTQLELPLEGGAYFSETVATIIVKIILS